MRKRRVGRPGGYSSRSPRSSDDPGRSPTRLVSAGLCGRWSARLSTLLCALARSGLLDQLPIVPDLHAGLRRLRGTAIFRHRNYLDAHVTGNGLHGNRILTCIRNNIILAGLTHRVHVAPAASRRGSSRGIRPTPLNVVPVHAGNELLDRRRRNRNRVFSLSACRYTCGGSRGRIADTDNLPATREHCDNNRT